MVKKKGAAVVDEIFPVDDIDDGQFPVESEFQDACDLLEDHQLSEALDAEDFTEGDVVEVRAASWREKRHELNRLQRARLGKAKELIKALLQGRGWGTQVPHSMS